MPQRDLRQAAAERATQVPTVSARPSQRRAAPDEQRTSRTRFALATRTDGSFDGRDGVTIGGLASVTERAYEMWDMFGPYQEVVAADAFDATLGRSPLVEFTVNHGAGGGLPMAHTRNGTLALVRADSDDDTPGGLDFRALVDPQRTDVADMLLAMERGDLAEASFKFHIVRGQWSPDYTEYRILEVDLERGDVSAVNFGANPLATSGLRASAPAQRRGVDLIDLADTRLRHIPGL